MCVPAYAGVYDYVYTHMYTCIDGYMYVYTLLFLLIFFILLLLKQAALRMGSNAVFRVTCAHVIQSLLHVICKRLAIALRIFTRNTWRNPTA